MDDRRKELETEILAETNRNPLRPPELGRLHSEWEAIRRRLIAAEKARNTATRAVLFDDQIVKLRALEELAARRDALNEARSSGLIPVDCKAQPPGTIDPICESPYIPAITSIPEWGPRAEDDSGEVRAYPQLGRYLGLTSAQYESMLEARKRFWDGAALTRMMAVVAEIREETARDLIDPTALGVRYAEVEAIRRKISENGRNLTAASVELLTPGQRVKLDALREAMGLRPIIDEARSFELLGSRCRESVYLIVGRTVGFSLFRNYLGDCPDKRALEELPK